MSNALYSELLKRPIAYHPVFRKITGSTAAAVMLSQMYYWSSEGRINEARDGWFHKTGVEWERETGLSRSEQDRARRDLVSAGLLEEERKGSPARMWFRLNVDNLNAAISQFAESCKLNNSSSLQNPANKNAPADKDNKNNSLQNSENKSAESCKQECEIPQTSLQNPANSHTETTAEITSETTDDDASAPADAFEPDFIPAEQLPDHERRLFDQPAEAGALVPFPSAPDNRGRFEMFYDWEPKQGFAERALGAGVNLAKIPTEQQEEILGEFRSYWEAEQIKQTHSQWEHKLITRLKMTTYTGTTPPPFPPPSPPQDRRERRRRITAATMNIHDTSWGD